MALPPNLQLTRVNVVGSSGSGKSTFARTLARLLGSRYIEIDQLFWDPNWSEPSDEVFFARVAQAVNSCDAWVLDGNYHRTQPIKWARTQTVIWLDYSRVRTVYRAIKRGLWRAWCGDELWPDTNNRETFAELFSNDSVVLFAYRTHAAHHERYDALFRNPPPGTPTLVRLRSPREAERFLRSLRKQSRSSSPQRRS